MAYGIGQEERRGFSNPLVRFRRIKGRIVPIVNKRRAGAEMEKIGKRTAIIGASTVATGIAAEKIASTKVFKKSKGVAAVKKKFGGGKIAKVAKFSVSKKFGAALIIGGAALAAMGFETQARTKLGRDVLSE